jgi:hypothetical protein
MSQHSPPFYTFAFSDKTPSPFRTPEKAYALENLRGDTGNWQNSVQVVGTKNLFSGREFLFTINGTLGE